MFYNVENLFDTDDDPGIFDEEFTPAGARYWTEYKYSQKLNNIFKVIVAVGEWDLPPVIGLAEVENRKVLEDLIDRTPLYKAGYEIIHYDSPDQRGIDVAFLYRKEYFTPVAYNPISVKWPSNIGRGTTRDILYVSGITSFTDTLHFFINHWPSRVGGQIETEDKRIYIAKLLRNHVDSLFMINPENKIIIMGDLNDYPQDRSVKEVLEAESRFKEIIPDKLYNLSYYLQEEKNEGTYKYNGQWGILDQIIVSGSLLDTSRPTYTTVNNSYVFSADFLLEKDEKYTGKCLKRTYIGYKYHGGYSDHLPTYLDILRRK